MAYIHLVVIGNLDGLSAMVMDPDEAYSELVVNSDAVLSAPIRGQRLEPISWWRAKVVEAFGKVDLCELSLGDANEFPWKHLPGCLRIHAVEDIGTAVIGEGHPLQVSGYVSRVKRETMSDITIRDLDDRVATVLRNYARTHGTSPEEEARRILTEFVDGRRDEFIRLAAALREATKQLVHDPALDSARIIRDERDAWG